MIMHTPGDPAFGEILLSSVAYSHSHSQFSLPYKLCPLSVALSAGLSKQGSLLYLFSGSSEALWDLCRRETKEPEFMLAEQVREGREEKNICLG